MSQEPQFPNWDKFTPEQKRLYQAWVKSLETAEAASIELIKSLNSKEITSDAINKSTGTESSQSMNLSSSEISRKIMPLRPDLFVCELKQIKCYLDYKLGLKSLEDCNKEYKICSKS
jgi:hypothetical protein